MDSGAVRLLTLDSLDVDDEFLSVALNDLARLRTLVVASDNLNFEKKTTKIILSFAEWTKIWKEEEK